MLRYNQQQGQHLGCTKIFIVAACLFSVQETSCRFGQSVLNQDTPQLPPFPGSATRTWGEAGGGSGTCSGERGSQAAPASPRVCFFICTDITLTVGRIRGVVRKVSVSPDTGTPELGVIWLWCEAQPR